MKIIFADNFFLSRSTIQSGKSVVSVGLGDFAGVSSIDEGSGNGSSVRWDSDTVDTDAFTVENRFDIDTWLRTKGAKGDRPIDRSRTGDGFMSGTSI